MKVDVGPRDFTWPEIVRQSPAELIRLVRNYNYQNLGIFLNGGLLAVLESVFADFRLPLLLSGDSRVRLRVPGCTRLGRFLSVDTPQKQFQRCDDEIVHIIKTESSAAPVTMVHILDIERLRIHNTLTITHIDERDWTLTLTLA